MIFGPSMTALTMRFPPRTVITPGDEVVCTRLDHDANVRPWVRAGADVRFADPEPDSLELPASAVEAVLTDRTKWVCVTAASNAVEKPRPRRDHGARPRRRRPRLRRRGARVAAPAASTSPRSACDALACSAYKWFGPHIGILCAAPGAARGAARPDKLRPSSGRACPTAGSSARCPFEALAGVRAAAEYVALARLGGGARARGARCSTRRARRPARRSTA